MEALTDKLLSQLPFYPELRPYIQIALPYISYALNTTTYLSTSFLLPLINTLLRIVNTSSATDLLTTLPVLIGTLLVSVYVLGWVKRQIFFWVGLVVQLVFYGSLALAGLAIWTVGPARCVDILSAWYQELAAANGATGRATGRADARGSADKLRGRGSGYAMGSGQAGTGWR